MRSGVPYEFLNRNNVFLRQQTLDSISRVKNIIYYFITLITSSVYNVLIY